MNWTAPSPPAISDGPLVGSDRPILEGFLAWQRATLLNICSGLTGQQLADHAIPTSNLTLLGLVRHMAKVERTWFRIRADGQQLPAMYDPTVGKDADFDDLRAELADEDFERYSTECHLADAAAAGLDFDDEFDVHGEPHSLRLIYVHMIAEYARHNGHADLIRQAIDGTTGR